MKKWIAFLFISAATLAGCKKDEPVTVPADGVRVLIFVNHHGVAIPNARVFVKNNTVSFPGTDTTLYDARYVTGVDGRLTLSGIPNGQHAYTYYAKGIDPTWDSTGTTPVWGTQFVITDSQTGESKDYSITINVSE